jgi:hypothetical protein
VKREVLLAIAVGAVAGLVGALTAPTQPGPAAPEVPAGSAAAAPEARDEGDLTVREQTGEARPEAAAPKTLTVHVNRDVEVRVSRWSDASHEWIALPPAPALNGVARFDLARGSYWVAAATAARVIDFDASTDLELVIESGVRVAGHVLEAGTRRPLSGVLLTARPYRSGLRAPEADAVTALTDGLGRFAFDEVSKGTVHLEAAAPGHRPNEADVPALTGADAVELFLEAACVASGRVIDERGAVASASVKEVTDDRPVLTDAQGRFSLEVDCTRAQLVARDASGRFATAKAGTGVTLELGRGELLHGVVRGKSGEPVAGADVTATTGDEQPRARTVTDAQGLFAVGPLAPGNYNLHARKGRGMQGAAYGVDVPAANDVELTVDDGAALTGRVVDGSGQPEPDAEVKVSWNSGRGERPAHTRTDDHGEFRIDDLPIGAATVTATARDNLGSADQRVYLTSAAAQQVTLTLTAHGRIVGTVSGPARAGAQVTAFAAGDGQTSRRAQADATGAFTLDVPAGEYRLNARALRPAVASVLRFDKPILVKAGEETRADLELVVDGGEGWGEMASVARGEMGASFENQSGSVQLSWLVSDSPASRAGLQVGDLVTAINGEPVRDALDTFARARGTPGANVTVTYRRDGSERTAAVTLAK